MSYEFNVSDIVRLSHKNEQLVEFEKQLVDAGIIPEAKITKIIEYEDGHHAYEVLFDHIAHERVRYDVMSEDCFELVRKGFCLGDKVRVDNNNFSQFLKCYGVNTVGRISKIQYSENKEPEIWVKFENTDMLLETKINELFLTKVKS